MTIPVLDLARQYREIGGEIDKALEGVFGPQQFILGKNVSALENEIAGYIGVPAAVGVASGTDALLIGLRALGLRSGDGVLTSPFTFFATGGAIHNAGGRPFFTDIDPVTFNIDPASVRRFLERECSPGGDGLPVHKVTGAPVRVLLPVHLYGLAAEMDELNAIAREHNMKVLEDACQAFGATYRGRRVGALGDLAAFSFFPTKNLGGAGDGGVITTPDPQLADRLRMIRVHGSRERYLHEMIGYNSRLDEVQAAVLRVKLPRVDGWNARREKVADLYGEGLKGIVGVTAPSHPSWSTHIYHQYVIRTARRDELKVYLEERKIGSMIYYPVPLHLQPCFKFLGYREGDLPNSEAAAAEVLALPIFPELTDSEVSEVCGAIRQFHSGRK